MSFRVAIVIGQLSYGGAERQVSLLARGLVAAGWPATVICLSGDLEPFGVELEQAGVPLRLVPRSRHYEPGRVLRLASLLRAEKVELIHSHLESANIYSYLARPLAGRPAFIPSVRTRSLKTGLFEGALIGRSLKAGDYIHANCLAAARTFAERYRIALTRFRVIHNGVNPFPETGREAKKAARQELGIPQGRLVVANLSKDSPDKNIPAFLRLVRSLSSRLGNLTALVAGQGLDSSYAGREKVAAAGGPEILFLGPLRDVRPVFAAADLFVLTSIREGLPNVIMEAMVSGLPVVSYAVGGVGELVEDGVSGRLVPYGDEEGLFEAALGLLQDSALAQTLGAAGRRRMLEHFSMEKTVSGATEMYLEVHRKRQHG
ncbi:MAG: glycosyltransferase [Candidatus Glassbacteria bacterium]|nr:glycosyltransferase [Candidatus Glassbacteria bacterium]